MTPPMKMYSKFVLTFVQPYTEMGGKWLVTNDRYYEYWFTTATVYSI